MPVTNNHKKPAGYVVFRTNATDGLKLNTANGKQGANTIGETVGEMVISEVMWSVDGTNNWNVKRGSNTVAVFAGSGYHDYQASGMQLEVDVAQRTSNVDITRSGGANGFIILKMHKKSGE